MHTVPDPTLTANEDCTRDEAEDLRLWMRGEGEGLDEAPALDWPYVPSDADARWWARQTPQGDDLDLWMPEDDPPPLPELSDDRTDALSGWAEGAGW